MFADGFAACCDRPWPMNLVALVANAIEVERMTVALVALCCTGIL